MAALQALVGDLTPPNEDIELLQQAGILPSPSSSTTTNPYTSGGNPLDPNTGTESTGVLQAIQKLDEKMTGGFAQIMAKLSNTPISGGGEIKSPQSIEMSAPSPDPAQAAAPQAAAPQPSFFNQLTSGVKAATNGLKSGVKSLVGAPSNTGTVAAAPETTTLAGGRRKTRKFRNSRRRHKRSRGAKRSRRH
jgi:hypothetical protein